MHLKLNEVSDWPGAVTECLMHIRKKGHEHYLIQKQGETMPGVGAKMLQDGLDCRILHQSPNYSIEAHRDKEYWWLDIDEFEHVDTPIPKNNRESIAFLQK